MITGTRVSSRVLLSRLVRSSVSGVSSTASAHAAPQPKPSLTLDPTLKSLLQAVDMSLMTHKHERPDEPTVSPPRELEAFENDRGDIEYYDIDHQDYSSDEPTRHREDRKSPAARFGSDGIGAVVLPPELQRTITALIEGTDKTLLHSDAKRLFAEQGTSGKAWATAYDVEYKNRKQSYRHSERDGIAFASIILPAHYSDIYAVLHHVKHRLGASWNVDRVIDWGCGTGGGLWAALNTFQKTCLTPGEGPFLANSSVIAYLGIDKRDGLVSIGKQLLQETNLGALSATWQKSFHEDDCIDLAEGHDALALSAFMLSALSTPFAKRNMVKEMWDSGAHTIILIDHNSPAGFENIAQARQLLLEMGLKEMEDLEMTDTPFRGSHVVAPCPHDHPCPLQRSGSSRIVCGFTQRLQRPTFVRRTKHAREGHEDIGYSYVVVRRGPRPSSSMLGARGLVGRIGGVGREAMEREAKARIGVPRELERAYENSHQHMIVHTPSPSVSESTAWPAPSLWPPALDINSIPADQPQAQFHVPLVDDGVGTVGAEVLSMANGGAETVTSPRGNVLSLEEKPVLAQTQSFSSTLSTSAPSTLNQTPANTPPASESNSAYSPSSSVYSEAEPRFETAPGEWEPPSNLEGALRREAYGWPRLVFPPLKKSGHIIIDACTQEGKIMRLTIPKSQGKQAFYDARKSSWGDIFPHPPKNKPIERFQPLQAASKSGVVPEETEGSHIGKRSKGRDKKKDNLDEKSYAAVDKKIRMAQKARWKASRREFANEDNGEELAGLEERGQAGSHC
ncbi:hypothetical protein PAXRUDRAFT_821028 [Paxillus rubicundulus Ve08.2h10]|uniref:Rsm22-domain-containing protein n=1 Tax=Paxillus rubicundulus Ve08.2h10 TaxID=930991 RepID=A0A0D0EDF3_9AGAM|nr:hypothetical protein PAXRUDRAFT_821028 [Paxillus rubicundulus Ve08.2h10]